MSGAHGLGEKPTFDDQKEAVCGGFRQDGGKDCGFPEPSCWVRRLEEELQPPPLAGWEGSCPPGSETKPFV